MWSNDDSDYLIIILLLKKIVYSSIKIHKKSSSVVHHFFSGWWRASARCISCLAGCWTCLRDSPISRNHRQSGLPLNCSPNITVAWTFRFIKAGREREIKIGLVGRLRLVAELKEQTTFPFHFHLISVPPYFVSLAMIWTETRSCRTWVRGLKTLLALVYMNLTANPTIKLASTHVKVRTGAMNQQGSHKDLLKLILIERLVGLHPLYEEERMHKMYSIVVLVQFKFALQHSKKHIYRPQLKRCNQLVSASKTTWRQKFRTHRIPRSAGFRSKLIIFEMVSRSELNFVLLAEKVFFCFFTIRFLIVIF
jgi:hypothetical protein